MQTLRVTHKPCSVFEIYHVKYKNLVHCAVKSHVYMLSTQISYNTIFMHNADFRSDP